MAGGIAAGELPDQLLHRTGAGEALQISHQRQAAITLASPAQPEALGQLNPQAHATAFTGEAMQVASTQGVQAKVSQDLRQHGFIAQHRWQDGEMGHGQSPSFVDPSELARAVQWPSAPSEPLSGEPTGDGSGRRLRLGVLASGNGSNFEALVAACRTGNLAADVTLLVVNNPGCGAIARAARLGIRWQLHDHRSHSSREALDRALISSFEAAGVDLVVMAGWMRIVTQDLIDAFPERLINIHPSLLPSFRGARAIDQALAAGVRISGCTAHLVSLEVDTGPILVQAAVPVHSDDDAATLAARIHAQEHRILPLAVQLAAQRLGLL